MGVTPPPSHLFLLSSPLSFDMRQRCFLLQDTFLIPQLQSLVSQVMSRPHWCWCHKKPPVHFGIRKSIHPQKPHRKQTAWCSFMTCQTLSAIQPMPAWWREWWHCFNFFDIKSSLDDLFMDANVVQDQIQNYEYCKGWHRSYDGNFY